MLLVLSLPKSALKGAMERVNWLAPGAEIEQLLDVPVAPTGAWKKLMHPETSHADANGRHNEPAFGQDAIAHYLKDDHVLLDLAVADRDSLFAKLAEFLEQRYDLAAEAIVAGLAAREALGSPRWVREWLCLTVKSKAWLSLWRCMCARSGPLRSIHRMVRP